MTVGCLMMHVRRKRPGGGLQQMGPAEKETGTLEAMEKEFRFQLPDLGFIPLLFTSALTGQRVRKILDVAIEVYDQRIRRISTSALNDFLTKVVGHNPPPSVKGAGCVSSMPARWRLRRPVSHFS